MAGQTSTQQAVQQALIEQVTQYIAQYTPNPRIISYKPNASGDVMGKFESQSRVFTFRLSDKGLVYKPLVQRKDNESDDDYALRFDTGSELWLEHFTQTQDRTDAAKAFKPKPSVRVPAVKQERGTKAQPKCSAISYHCGVCISLGKNCIKNANTVALKERLQKINSLSRMAAKGEAVPQVKTGVIGAKVDPKSLMKKAQAQARELAKSQDKAISPKEYEFLTNKKNFKKLTEDQKAEELSSNPLPISLLRDVYASGDAKLISKWEGVGGQAKKDRNYKRGNFDPNQNLYESLLKDYDEFRVKNNVPSGTSLSDWKAGQDKKLKTKAKQSALRAAAEPNKTTTLQTPLPLTAQSQKRLERGESISDNETYHVKKEGDKFRVTDPNKFEDKGKLVDKAGLAAHMKELESKPSAVKKSSSMNPAIPINNNPDTMLRALRDGRLIGDAKQGYEIQQRGKDEYLVTTMPNKNGDYSGTLSKKELVSFIKNGGDASKFNKASKPDVVKPTKTNSQKSAQASKLLEKTKTSISGLQDRLEKLQDESDSLAKQLEDSKSKVPTNRTKKRASDYKDIGKMSKALDEEFANGGNAIAVTKQKGNKKQIDELNNKINENYNTRSEIQSQIKTLTKRAQQLDRSAYDYGNKPDTAIEDKKLPPIPLTSGKNLTPSQKKQSRTADQVAIDRTKSDVGNATKRINTLDDSIKKLKAGKGVMSEADLKKVASLERQKGEWEKTRDGHKAKLEGLSSSKSEGSVNPVVEKRESMGTNELDLARKTNFNQLGSADARQKFPKATKELEDKIKQNPKFEILEQVAEKANKLGSQSEGSRYSSPLQSSSPLSLLGYLIEGSDNKYLTKRDVSKAKSAAKNIAKTSLGNPESLHPSKLIEKHLTANNTSDAPRKDSADLYHVNIPNSILVSRQDADDCILTYIQDNSGNLMGVCQINGVKYRFLKPVFGATVLTPLSETGLGYLFGLAPDLTLREDDPLKGIFTPFFDPLNKALASR